MVVVTPHPPHSGSLRRPGIPGDENVFSYSGGESGEAATRRLEEEARLCGEHMCLEGEAGVFHWPAEHPRPTRSSAKPRVPRKPR